MASDLRRRRADGSLAVLPDDMVHLVARLGEQVARHAGEEWGPDARQGTSLVLLALVTHARDLRRRLAKAVPGV